MENQEKLLEQLNRFTRREHTADEVYLFDLILCDNDIDRDGDCFSDAALAEMQKRFIGVTGIFDHNPHAGNQTARIFCTEVVTDPERMSKTGAPYRYLRANAYMVRTEGNADLIREIDAGIKKEVSVSCAVGRQQCSVCGANRLEKPCSHIKGKTYGGALCYSILDQITDVYEWSFVAVPAQRRAGVTKTCGEMSCDPEKETLRRMLDLTAQQLDELTESLRRDVVRLCYQAGGSDVCTKLLAETTRHLNTSELLSMQRSLRMRMQAAEHTSPQLAQEEAGKDPHGQTVSAYRMDSGTRG